MAFVWLWWFTGIWWSTSTWSKYGDKRYSSYTCVCLFRKYGLVANVFIFSTSTSRKVIFLSSSYPCWLLCCKLRTSQFRGIADTRNGTTDQAWTRIYALLQSYSHMSYGTIHDSSSPITHMYQQSWVQARSLVCFLLSSCSNQVSFQLTNTYCTLHADVMHVFLLMSDIIHCHLP